MSNKCPKCGTGLVIVAESAPAARTTEPSAGSRPAGTDCGDVAGVLGDLLGRIDDGKLGNNREREFVEGIRARFGQYGFRTLLSDKQRKWLGDLAARFDDGLPFVR